MNKEFEKILKKTKEKCKQSYITNHGKDYTEFDICTELSLCFNEVQRIVQEVVEEYNGGWIPCSERLPEESGEYLTWVEYDGDRFIAIDEIDCDGIIKEWNCSTDYKIIAWQPLPQPYQSRGE